MGELGFSVLVVEFASGLVLSLELLVFDEPILVLELLLLFVGTQRHGVFVVGRGIRAEFGTS